MNRRVDRRTLFESAADYDAFSQILGWAQQICEMPITAWCLMPNHWHLIVKPRDTPHLSSFMHRIQTTHAVGLRRQTDTRGHGSVYGNRFKHFLIHPDRLLRSVVYVERNPVKAGLVRAATSWKHGSASTASVDTAWPRVERLPTELERLRPELLLHPLPEEFSRTSCARAEPPPRWTLLTRSGVPISLARSSCLSVPAVDGNPINRWGCE